MGKSHDPVLLALIATLEEQARKRGKASVIKRMVAKLTAAGADDATIARISDLRTPAAPVQTAAGPAAGKTASRRRTGAGKSKVSKGSPKVPETPPGALQ